MRLPFLLLPSFCLSLAAFSASASISNSESSPKPNEPSQSMAGSAPTIESILNKMTVTAAKVNYRGSFTYQNQTSIALQSFKIEHWVDADGEHDLLLFLNGQHREIAREGQPVDCKAMGDKLLTGSLTAVAGKLVGLNQLYSLEIGPEERIANRATRVLRAWPKDPYRYGYFFNVDEETGVVLRLWLLDETTRPLERYQFVSFDVVKDLPVGKMQPQGRVYKANATITPCNPSSLTTPDYWNVNWLPPGFAYAGQRLLPNGQEMLMYTDGLTTFSIFLELAKGLIPEGEGRRGATSAFMTRLESAKGAYRVNVVGEIPVEAAKKIAQNIALK